MRKADILTTTFERSRKHTIYSAQSVAQSVNLFLIKLESFKTTQHRQNLALVTPHSKRRTHSLVLRQAETEVMSVT